MPVDAAGNRADIVMDAGSTISRMNLGRLYEQYIGAAARDMTKEIRAYLGLEKQSVIKATKAIHQLLQKNPTVLNGIYHRLLGFYHIVSPRQYDFFANRSESDQIEHLADIVHDGVYVYFPTDNEPETDTIVRQLEAYCPPTYGPVTYVGNSGIPVTTQYPVRIGPMYMYLLEKISDDWSSVAYGRLQSLGVLSTLTRSEKFVMPYRSSAPKVMSETEGRILAGYIGREAVGEFIDRNNAPLVNRQIVNSLLEAESPSNIENAVDRSTLPIGGSKPLQLMRHINTCTGWLPVYEPEEQ